MLCSMQMKKRHGKFFSKLVSSRKNCRMNLAWQGCTIHRICFIEVTGNFAGIFGNCCSIVSEVAADWFNGFS